MISDELKTNLEKAKQVCFDKLEKSDFNEENITLIEHGILMMVKELEKLYKE